MSTLRLFIGGFFALAVLYACNPTDPLHTEVESTAIERIAAHDRDTAAIGDTLRVMTWNIQHGGAGKAYFYHCTSDAALAKAQRVRKNLNGIAGVIDSLKPDVVFLQRIDRLAKRSAYINQVQYLLDRTHLNYGIYTPLLRTDFLPYYGLGPINSGIATLTSSEQTQPQRLSLTNHTSENMVSAYFQHQRVVLKTTVTDSAGNTRSLFNVWLTPYPDDGTKVAQIGEVKGYLQEAASASNQIIAGGTFHTIPPEATQRTDFADESCDAESPHFVSDYTGEVAVFAPFYELWHPAVPVDVYPDSSRTFTYARKPDVVFSRKVDYIFSNDSSIGSFTLQTMLNETARQLPWSVHAPVIADYPYEKR